MSHDESIDSNLSQFCLEVDSEFQAANDAAAQDFLRYMEKYDRPLEVVELGCGDGAALNTFERLGVKTFGVDINPEKLASNDHDYWQGDMAEWLGDQPAKSVKNIFMHHALEHIVSIKEVLDYIYIVLEKGGIFYCIVPADDHPHEVHHTAFDSALELAPPKMQTVTARKQERFGHPEYLYVGVKP